MLVRKIRRNVIVLIPQNAEWTNTSVMVRQIANISGKKIAVFKIMRPMVAVGGKCLERLVD